MKRHSGPQIYEARLRAIAKWKRYRDRWLLRSWSTAMMSIYEVTPEEFWGQEGRFNKLSLSCDDHHAICECSKAERKFRSHKKALYRQLDQIEENAY